MFDLTIAFGNGDCAWSNSSISGVLVIFVYGKRLGLFILVGSCDFHLTDFMVKSVLVVLQAQLSVVGRRCASLGASFWQRFFHVICNPNCKTGIVRRILMTLTLSCGRLLIMTWMLHNSDCYKTLRLV